MKIVNWLIIDRNGIKGTRKTKPDLKYNEIAVKINMKIPKIISKKRT